MLCTWGNCPHYSSVTWQHGQGSPPPTHQHLRQVEELALSLPSFSPWESNPCTSPRQPCRAGPDGVGVGALILRSLGRAHSCNAGELSLVVKTGSGRAGWLTNPARSRTRIMCWPTPKFTASVICWSMQGWTVGRDGVVPVDPGLQDLNDTGSNKMSRRSPSESPVSRETVSKESNDSLQ